MDDCLERTRSMIFMTKLKPSLPEDEVDVEKEEKTTDQESSNDGGGIINQLISHLPGFESNGGTGDLKSQKSTKAKEEDLVEKIDDNGGGHGLMDQFITNFFCSNDPAPDSEEASLLIYIAQD